MRHVSPPLLRICLVVTLGFLVLAPSAGANITLTFYPASTFNSNTSVMDAALGITGYSIDNFESTTLLPGLTITISGGVPTTTWTALPAVFNASLCGTLTNYPWDGQATATNATGNLMNSCNTPTNLAQETTFTYWPGTTSFGVGLSNFQSPNSPEFPITNHELFINGTDIGVLETLAGANWTPGLPLNTYLRIDATGSDSISTVAFENLSGNDLMEFDHLALVATQTSTVPEPTSIALLGTGLTGILRLGRRKRRQ